MTGEELELIVSNVADIYGNVQILGDSSRFVVGTTVAAVGANAINLSSVKSSQLENFSDSMDIRFTVTSPATNDRLINFTISGTATYNEDYTVRFPAGQPVTSTFNGSQGKISILANTTQAILRIKPIKDNISEPDETVTITLAEGGNYLLGAVYTKTDTIKNDDLSNPVVIKNGPTNICAGQSLTLSTNSTIDGQPVYSYYWDNGTFNSGDQTVNITSPGTYTLTVYTANGFSGVSDPIVVTISPLAAPSIGPDVTVIKNCFEETTNLLSLFNTTGLTSTWNTQNTTMAPPGTYQLVAANSGGCTDTAYAYVKLDVATWTGSQSSDWNTPANWNTNKVPTSTMHVIIPGGTANPCVVGSADVTVASIQVRNGGILQTINNRKINVAGKCLTLPPSPGFKLSK